MLELYSYQTDTIIKIKAQLRAGKRRLLIQSPTGSGKTVIFSHIVSEMKKRGKRALIITDRIELLFETGGTLEEFGLTPFHIMAGQMVEPPMEYQVYVAMSQTLRRRIDTWRRFWNSFDVVIMDECHKQEFNPYFEQNAFTNNPIILGFSATPIRIAKQRQLAADFEIMIKGLDTIQVGDTIQVKKFYGMYFFDSKTKDRGDPKKCFTQWQANHKHWYAQNGWLMKREYFLYNYKPLYRRINYAR